MSLIQPIVLGAVAAATGRNDARLALLAWLLESLMRTIFWLFTSIPGVLILGTVLVVAVRKLASEELDPVTVRPATGELPTPHLAKPADALSRLRQDPRVIVAELFGGRASDVRMVVVHTADANELFASIRPILASCGVELLEIHQLGRLAGTFHV